MLHSSPSCEYRHCALAYALVFSPRFPIWFCFPRNSPTSVPFPLLLLFFHLPYCLIRHIHLPVFKSSL